MSTAQPLPADGLDLVGYLQALAGMAARHHADQDGWCYPSIPQLVLALTGGRTQLATMGLPDGVTAGEPKDCFRNAHMTAITHHNLIYVEGYALASVVPVPHAWCLNPQTGLIVDPTWAGLTHTNHATYLGVPFATEFIARNALVTRAPSVLETDHHHGDRALRDGFTLNTAGLVTGWGRGAHT